MNLSLKDGEYLVRLSRRAVKTYLKTNKVIERPSDIPEVFKEKRGVFVTLNTYPDKKLRGCIGYPLAYEPLVDAVISSAISAAFSDPRFAPLLMSELDKIIFEVTVLSDMILLDDKIDYKRQIEIGRDGLFIVCGANSGLLLPQVPVEWGWDKGTFLKEICLKAGLYETCYENKNCKLHRFTGQIFCETKPNGDIVEKDNNKEAEYE